MAEILVSDVCARRLSAAGDCFVGCRYDPPRRQHAPGCPPVSIVLRIVFFIVFSIVIHCSCAGGFSLAVARTCIVIPSLFPLQIACIFFAALWTGKMDCTPWGETRKREAPGTCPA